MFCFSEFVFIFKNFCIDCFVGYVFVDFFILIEVECVIEEFFGKEILECKVFVQFVCKFEFVGEKIEVVNGEGEGVDGFCCCVFGCGCICGCGCGGCVICGGCVGGVSLIDIVEYYDFVLMC